MTCAPLSLRAHFKTFVELPRPYLSGSTPSQDTSPGLLHFRKCVNDNNAFSSLSNIRLIRG
eukprot:5600875-Amphidinium_carterae.1